MTAFLIPGKGMMVRIPGSREIVPKTGMLVELTSYWNRRIRDSSVFVSSKIKKEETKERKFGKEEEDK